MVEQQILNLDNVDGTPAGSGVFIAVQTTLGDTNRRSLDGSIAAAVQSPMVANIDAQGKKIFGAADPSNDQDYVTLKYLEDNFVANDVTQDINLENTFKVINALDPASAQDYVTLGYLETNFISNPLTITLNANENKISNLLNPTEDGDAVSKNYAENNFVSKPININIDLLDTFKVINALDPVAAQDYVTRAYGDANYLVGESGANQTLSNLTDPTAVSQNLNMNTKALAFPSTLGANSLQLRSEANNVIEYVQVGGIATIKYRIADSDTTPNTEFSHQMSSGQHSIIYQSFNDQSSTQIVTQSYFIDPSSDPFGADQAILTQNFVRVGGGNIQSKALAQLQNNGTTIFRVLANGTLDLFDHTLAQVNNVQLVTRSSNPGTVSGHAVLFSSGEDDDHNSARLQLASGSVNSLTKSFAAVTTNNNVGLNNTTPRLHSFANLNGFTTAFGNDTVVNVTLPFQIRAERVYIFIIANGTSSTTNFNLRVNTAGVITTFLAGVIGAAPGNTGLFIVATSTNIDILDSAGVSFFIEKGSGGNLDYGGIGFVYSSEYAEA